MAAPLSPSDVPRISLRKSEAARSIGVSINTFNRMIDDGIIPRPFCYGTMQMWLVSDLQAGIASLPTKEDQPSNEWEAA